MPHSRRGFLQTAIGAETLAVASTRIAAGALHRPSYTRLDDAANQLALPVESLGAPVTIKSLELLRNGRVFLVRVRSTSGAEGMAVPNADRLIDTYPIFLKPVAPFFIGNDARQLESRLWELYRYKGN